MRLTSQQLIVGWFTNRYHQGYLKHHPAPPKTGGAGTSSSPVATTRYPHSTLPGSADGLEQLHRAIRRAFILLKGRYPAREIWIDEHALEIQDEITRISSCEDNKLVGGAARNKAIANLWNMLSADEQDVYEQKADEIAQDVNE